MRKYRIVFDHINRYDKQSYYRIEVNNNGAGYHNLTDWVFTSQGAQERMAEILSTEKEWVVVPANVQAVNVSVRING